MPPSVVSILQAARTVVAKRGFARLTIEAVANEANVSLTLIPYHFGNRAGLVEPLLDSLFHDLFLASAAGRRRLREPFAAPPQAGGRLNE